MRTILKIKRYTLSKFSPGGGKIHTVFSMIFLLYLFSYSLMAQDLGNDSLLHLLSETTDDSLRAELILEIDFKDPYESLEQSRIALAVFEKLNNPSRKLAALNKIGFSYWKLGNFKETIDYFNDALKIAKELENDNWIARVSNNLGAVYWGLNDYNKALELFQESLVLRTALDYKKGMSLINNNIGLIYQEWKLYDEAVEYHKEGLALANEIDDLSARAYSYHNLGLCY
jgi:tetratricopeptide (TPR) repeat protein